MARKPFRIHKANSFSQVLYFQLIVTVIELGVIVFFLMRVRSLEHGAIAGFSVARLMLILVWVIVFVLFIMLLMMAWINPSQFSKASNKIEGVVMSPYYHARISGWLFLLAISLWVAIGLIIFKLTFWSFIWSSLPVLLVQYFPVLVVIALWVTQSRILLGMLRVPGNQEPQDTIFPWGIALFVLSFVLYSYLVTELGLGWYSNKSYFPDLAQSFLVGRLDLPDPQSIKDLTLFNEKYYVSFPPLGALLMLPYVAINGPRELNVLLFNVLFSSLGISFIFGALNGMKKVGLNRLFGWENAFLALFLGFGTSQFSLTLRPLVNFTSQVLATTFLSLSLYFIFSGSARSVKLYALFSGIALGLAVLSRPNVVFAWIVVASILVYRQQMNNEIAVKKIITPLIISLIPIGIVILILFWYNTIRFGSPFDFGYGYMLVADTLKQDLIVYGQFHPQFIFRNIFDNFLRLPYWSNSCQMITPQPEGTSILLASPVIVYLVCSFRKKLYTIGAWISIILLTLLHLLYYNSGAVQFGYRFSMDFMPIVVSLLAFGFNEKLSKGAIILILFSIAANFIGTLWIVHRWCINY